MVESCSAINCTAKREKLVLLKFLSIPKDPARRKQWLVALRRENFNPGNRAVICENHFTKDDFEINVHGNRVLKITAVPSVFNFPAHLQKMVKVRRPLKRKLIRTEPGPSNTDLETGTLETHVEMVSVESIPNDLIEGTSGGNIHDDPFSCVQKIESKRRCRDPVFFGDFKETDLENEIKRKRFWKVAHETVSKYKKLNKYYQCVNRRQNIKIHSLLDDLMKREKISSQQQLVFKRNPNPEPTPSTSSENNDSNFIEDKNEVKDNVEEFKVENEVKDNVEESSSYDHNCIKAYQIKKGEDICEVNVKMEPIYTEENYCDIPVSEDSKIKRELDTDDISTAVTSKRVKLENGIEIKQENPQESLDTNFFVKIETEEIQIKDENIQIKEENIQ